MSPSRDFTNAVFVGARPSRAKGDMVEGISCRCLKAVCGRRNCAFSLVEVVLALGILSFAGLAVVGLLVAGLNSSRESNTKLAVANITRHLRADLQATNYTSLTNGTNYFTDEGYQITNGTTSNRFYTAVISPAAPVYPTNGTTSTNAKTVALNIFYPYPANALGITNSFFVAQ